MNFVYGATIASFPPELFTRFFHMLLKSLRRIYVEKRDGRGKGRVRERERGRKRRERERENRVAGKHLCVKKKNKKTATESIKVSTYQKSIVCLFLLPTH